MEVSLFSRVMSRTIQIVTIQFSKPISSDLSGIVQYKYTLAHTHDDEASEVVINYGSGKSKILNENEYGIVGKKLFILTVLPKDTSKLTVTYSYQP